MQYVLICHRCGRDLLLADVCPLCGGTYCEEECIESHVRGIELPAVERAIIAERTTEEGQYFLLPTSEGESQGNSYREGEEGARAKTGRRRRGSR